MNKLPPETRAKILHLLCEGNSIRAITRLLGVGKNTVARLLCTAGQACDDYQHRTLVNLKCERLEIDELWSFTYCKEANTQRAKNKPAQAGDTWTWVSICAKSKLIPSWYIGEHDLEAATILMDDLKSRLSGRVQLSTDGHRAFLQAIETTFGDEVDYGQIVKIFGRSDEGPRRYSPPVCVGTEKHSRIGNPDMKLVSTSYVERNNGIIRQHCKRYARLTHAFSKKIENHAHAFALHAMYHNFVKIHGTHRMSPAMAAGVTGKLWEMSDLVAMIEEWENSND